MTRKQYRIVDLRAKGGDPSWVFSSLKEAKSDLYEARLGYPFPKDLVIEERVVGKWERRK